MFPEQQTWTGFYTQRRIERRERILMPSPTEQERRELTKRVRQVSIRLLGAHWVVALLSFGLAVAFLSDAGDGALLYHFLLGMFGALFPHQFLYIFGHFIGLPHLYSWLFWWGRNLFRRAVGRTESFPREVTWVEEVRQIPVTVCVQSDTETPRLSWTVDESKAVTLQTQTHKEEPPRGAPAPLVDGQIALQPRTASFVMARPIDNGHNQGDSLLTVRNPEGSDELSLYLPASAELSLFRAEDLPELDEPHALELSPQDARACGLFLQQLAHAVGARWPSSWRAVQAVEQVQQV